MAARWTQRTTPTMSRLCWVLYMSDIRIRPLSSDSTPSFPVWTEKQGNGVHLFGLEAYNNNKPFVSHLTKINISTGDRQQYIWISECKVSPHPHRERFLVHLQQWTFSLSIERDLCSHDSYDFIFSDGCVCVCVCWSHLNNSLQTHIKVLPLIKLQFLQCDPRFSNKLIVAKLILITHRYSATTNTTTLFNKTINVTSLKTQERVLSQKQILLTRIKN